ncbi:DNA topoisomerase III [Fredinandcohnia onubensis]|uniref:DNA topoisomerase III n=1 Tax=Fredinandcohnia onubensis TaxID=1571209 RepID=UPI000C0BEAD1|nr:DNA topoisomerase III [Fredinandcohnia onubensis]
MKVIIAEKPDQAMKLAAPFRSKKSQGFIEVSPDPLFPKGAYFTWAVGHICELLPPEEYNPAWKKWRIETLPLIPDHFSYRVMKSKWKQFTIIKNLLRKPEITEIIHAGDAGREGELIIRNIIEMAKVSKPLKRLWISSLTEKAVKDGFQNLLMEEDTRNLYFEAKARACADWIVGMNASRVYTLLLKQKGVSDVFSAGRVQTPTLALIVKREKEIANFKSEPFWEVFANFQINGKQYEGKWMKDNESRLSSQDMAERIAAFCQDKPAEIAEVETEKKEYQPPLLFNLSSLQATANKAFKFSPKKTLDVAQSLYTKGIISYPRSDSSYITKGEAQTIPEVFSKLEKLEDYKAYFPTPNVSIMNNSRYVNEKKVTDHYAIIPTEQVPHPAKLSGDEKKIYDLIVKRLIAAHYKPAIFNYTTVKTLVDKRAEFVTKGKVKLQEGWRKVLFEENSKDEDVILPALEKGEAGVVENSYTKEGKTQPPKRYTEGQLITLMKTAGKHIDNDELEKILAKTEGLGTEATRAGIITMLKQRNYINVEKNQVFATEKGILLIDVIGEKILASPEMTAKWEQRLHEIGQGKASPASFMIQTKKLSQKIVDDAKVQSDTWDFSSINIENVSSQKSSYNKKEIGTVVGTCKKCGGEVINKGKFYGCANYKTKGCQFTISGKILGKTITKTNVQKLLSANKTNLIKGFKKESKMFDAYLKWNDQTGKIEFEFPAKVLNNN